MDQVNDTTPTHYSIAPLQWQDEPFLLGIGEVAYVNTSLGFYYSIRLNSIMEKLGTPVTFDNTTPPLHLPAYCIDITYPINKSGNGHRFYAETIEEAKELSQKDWENRLREVLIVHECGMTT